MCPPEPTGAPARDTSTTGAWWRHGVVYQVYPRSFADGDGDGTGDIAGLRDRLGYLRALGVDALWLSPWYPSPFRDGGYDVADYCDIDPRFGTLEDAEGFIDDAHRHGLKVVVDLVPNHTSSEHEWFRAALDAGPGSPERRRYVFRPGRGPDGGEPPNNWRSVFGGPAWERVADGEWYLHLFDVGQPDLNWENEEVRAGFDRIFEFWLARGVDGFRVDVAHGMVKDQDFPDLKRTERVLEGPRDADHPHWDRLGIHEINRRWRSVLDASGRDVMMVAEAWVHAERLPLYLRPDEYHQSFNFEFLETPWELDRYRAAIAKACEAAAEVGSAPTWTLSNHDVMRHATRLGLPGDVSWRRWPLEGPHELLDVAAGARRARAATLLLLALPGSVYIYQGEELGLPEVWDLPTDVLDDPVWANSGGAQKGRDGCRVPIPWTLDGASFGFGSGPAWLPQPSDWGARSVEAQTGVAGSSLELYRSAIEARRRLLEHDERIEWLDADDGLLAFRRGSGVTCVVNFGDRAAPMPAGEVVVASAPLGDGLGPDTAVWLAPS